MKRKKILALLSCSARNKILIGLLATSLIGVGGVFLSSNANYSNNTIGINKIILTEPLNNNGDKACVINGNDNLVLYSSSTDPNVNDYISIGEMLTINSYSNGYYNVTVQETGATGYIASSNMEKIVSGVGYGLTSLNETAYITNVSTDVNLREEATMNSATLLKLKNDTQVTLLGKQGEWYKADINGTVGYIYEEYIAIANTSSSTKASDKTASLNPTPVKSTGGTEGSSTGNVSISQPTSKTTTDTSSSSTKASDKTTSSNPAPVKSTGGTESSSTGKTSIKESAPTITASNVTVNYGNTFNDSMLKASASQGATLTYSGTVNTDKVGTYDVTVTATNSLGQKTSKVVIVTVSANMPVITANNVTINIGTKFSASSLNISAIQDGQPAQYTVNSSDVNTNKPGTYNVTITSTANGKTATKTITVTVKDTQPILTVDNVTVNKGSIWNDSLLHATATSSTGVNLDGSIKYNGTINTSKVGTQTITVSVTDQYGETTTKTVVVTVKAVQIVYGISSGTETFDQALQSDLMNMINQYRKANGESAYIQNSACQAMGLWKADDMATNHYFSPTDPEGQNTLQALQYEYNVKDWKEAIALGTSIYGQRYSETQIMGMAKSIFTEFKNSPVHNAIMLSNSDSLAGLGVYVGSNGNIYYSLEVASQAYTSDTTATFGSAQFNTK